MGTPTSSSDWRDKLLDARFEVEVQARRVQEGRTNRVRMGWKYSLFVTLKGGRCHEFETWLTKLVDPDDQVLLEVRARAMAARMLSEL